MKKFLKVFFISVSSLLGVVIIAICIALWFVFTPEKLTPFVRTQAAKYINCQSKIGEVELTFFSTFPHFGIKIDSFALINPVTNAPFDTLVSVDQMVGVVDAGAWWKRKELILTGFRLTNGTINVFTDSLGKTNYDIVVPDTTTIVAPETKESDTLFSFVDIKNVELSNVDIQYIDFSLKLNAVIRDLAAEISGTIWGDSVNGNIKVNNSVISLEYDGEKYLQGSVIKLNIPAELLISREFLRLRNASASINDMNIILNGTIDNDSINILTDLSYNLKSWPLKKFMALVPPSYNSYFEGIDADGLLSSDGTIKGIFNDSIMPLMNIHLLLEKGTLKYTEFPIPMHDIEGDITFCSDMMTDSITFVRIDRFSAKTPRSTIKSNGFVNRLFSDIYCNFVTDASLTLGEFKPMIPADMNVDLKGSVSGQIKSAFTLTQLEKMEIEKMKLSGSLTMKDFSATYDTISLKTDHSKIDFALPNTHATNKKTKFVFTKISTGDVNITIPGNTYAFLKNASITLETSDLRDTTKLPSLICTYSLDSLAAGMDTLSLAVAKPYGNASILYETNESDKPKIRLQYNSEELGAVMGQNTAVFKKINLDVDILNDNTKKDIFEQWIANGFIDINQGVISSPSIPYPVEIPSVIMDFSPETFNIKDSRIIIDKSDFQLSGSLNNVLSHFKSDSLLKGNFNFVSSTTDIAQLMSLTSGLGDTTVVDTTYSGPYMVPRGVDLLLNTKIGKATMGIDTISNINGNIRVKDGILLLDEITCETPAANIQLTAMYRTPRTNHLFLGLDYHMLNIEIGKIPEMIPDVDTIMPMLRSFKGKGEFHITIETYLDSLYNVKLSTLRGAASIKGNNLVLMDGKTFSEISKTLKFNKHTENRVDSLSAEFTIFRNEIDIYPFLIVMDKYKAVVAGRHNLDMSFDYNISVVDCPVPIKLGVDVKGNMDDLSYNLGKCKYAEFYRPSSRDVVENKQLELRKLIRDALTRKVMSGNGQ